MEKMNKKTAVHKDTTVSTYKRSRKGEGATPKEDTARPIWRSGSCKDSSSVRLEKNVVPRTPSTSVSASETTKTSVSRQEDSSSVHTKKNIADQENPSTSISTSRSTKLPVVQQKDSFSDHTEKNSPPETPSTSIIKSRTKKNSDVQQEDFSLVHTKRNLPPKTPPPAHTEKAVPPKTPSTPITRSRSRKTSVEDNSSINATKNVTPKTPSSSRSVSRKTSVPQHKDSSSVHTKKNIVSKTPSTRLSTSRSTKTLVPQRISSKQVNQSQPQPSSDPIHYISWDGLDEFGGLNEFAGLDEECELLGQNCCLCDKDFTHRPEGDYEDYRLYEDGFEDIGQPELSILPSVDILSCGHAFHTECLMLALSDEQSCDPPCILCLSMA